MNDAGWDVVVVGSGAGGAAAALGLCRRGLSVLLLDAGPRFDPAGDYAQTRPDWELREFPDKPGSKGRVVMAPAQPLPHDEPLLVSMSRGDGRQVEPGRRQMSDYLHVRGVG